jgi:hypothetical protein
MDRFFTCDERMLLNPQEHMEISKEMETYKIIARTFGFDMVVHDRKTKMLGKLHFVSNLNVSSSFVSNFKVYIYVFLICYRCLVDKL